MVPDVRLLRSFLMVAQELHFSRAAGKLRLAQPALTAQIHKLEECLGAKLFERSNRMRGLTAAGRALVPEAQAIVEHADALGGLIQRAVSGETGRLRLGIIPPAATVYVADCLRRFTSDHPAVELSVRQGDQDRLIDRLIFDDLDLVIGRPTRTTSELRQSRLFSEEQGVLLAEDDTLARAKSVPLKALAGRELILLRSNTHFGQLLLEHALRHHVRLVPLRTAEDFPSLYWMVRAGLGIAPCSLLLAESLPMNLKAKPLRPPPAKLEINAIWRGTKPGPAVAKLLEMLSQTFAG